MTQGVAFNGSVAKLSGGTGTVTYALTAGSLPAGLILSSSGIISGIPSVIGAYNFTVTATDSSIPTPLTKTQVFNVNIMAAVPMNILPLVLPTMTQGVAFSQVLSVSGGVGPYTYSITAGALPTGLTLTTGGTLSGTPTLNGSYTFTITVTDSLGAISHRAYIVNVS